MTEEEYYTGEFKDGELNCQADPANYRKAVEEFYLEYRDQMDEKPERSSGDILRSHTAEHFSIPGRNSQFSVGRIFCSVFGFVAMVLGSLKPAFSRRGVHVWEEETKNRTDGRPQ